MDRLRNNTMKLSLPLLARTDHGGGRSWKILMALLLVCVWQPAISFPGTSFSGRPIVLMDRPGVVSRLVNDPQQAEHDYYNDDRRNFLKQSTGAGTAASLFAGGWFPSVTPAAAAEPKTLKKQDLRDVKVALWGFGNQNKLMAKYLRERQVPIVAVISHHDLGKDYTTVDLDPWGKPLGGRRGVKIVSEEDAKATLVATQPDICIICTRSTMQDLQPSLVVCADSKVNVLTIAEEVLHARATSPDLANEMDALFRENGVTLTGGGFEDVALCEMCMTLSSTMHRIDALEGSEQYNLDDYGLVLAEEHGAGLTAAQFQKDIVETPHPNSILIPINDWLVSGLGLTLKKHTEKREPTFAGEPLYSAALGREIPVGDCTGMKVTITSTTKEGIRITMQFIGKCYEPSDSDYGRWSFQGEPSGVGFSMDRMPSSPMTNTAAISRVLQVVNAPAGYVTADTLTPIPRYEHWT